MSPGNDHDSLVERRLPPARHRSRPVPAPALEVAAAEDGTSEAGPDYKVGYGKPPVHSRFKPGQSGNPKGRTKGSKNFNKLILDVFEEPIQISTPRGHRKVMRIEAMLYKLVEQGGKGSLRALEVALRHYAAAKSAQAPAIEADETNDLTAADEASLAVLLELFAAGPSVSSAHEAGEMS